MKKTRIILTLLVGMTGMAGAFAQETDDAVQLPVFGVGLNIEQLRNRDIVASDLITPANNIILTLNIRNRVRIEPEFGVASVRSENDYGKNTGTSTRLACGFYGQFQKGRVNLYAGAVVESITVKTETNGPGLFGGSTQQEQKETAFGFGPALGGEYFLGRHFSFGGRVGFLFSKLSFEEDNASQEEDDVTMNYTTTGLQVKFYF